MEDETMLPIVTPGKEITFVHLNPSWGYLAYIEKSTDESGKPVFKVVKVPLEGIYGCKRVKREERS